MLITDDDFHRSLPLRTVMRFAGSLSHQPRFTHSASVPLAEGGSTPASTSTPPEVVPDVGAAAASLKIVTGIEGAVRQSVVRR